MKHYNQVTTFTEIQVYSDKASDKFAQYQLHVTAYTINQSGSVVIFLSRFKSFIPKESTHTSVSLLFFFIQTTPPEYHPKDMQVPVAMFYGDHDFLADRTDVQFLLDNLPNIVHQKEIPNWNHVDFIIGRDAYQLLYTDILNLLSKYN